MKSTLLQKSNGRLTFQPRAMEVPPSAHATPTPVDYHHLKQLESKEEMESHALLPLAIILVLASTWFVIHHAKQSTSFFILSLSILSFGLGFASVALLPIDLTYASSTSHRNYTITNETVVHDTSTPEEGKNPTLLPWVITYWTTFVLAWFLLPLTRDTIASGHFTLLSQLRNGVSASLWSICISASVGMVAVFLTAMKLHSLEFTEVILPLLMASGNTYGLVLVSLLLGNGLVNIPKRFWREACPAEELRRTRILACGVEEELFDAVMALEDAEGRVEGVCSWVVELQDGERMGNAEGDDDTVMSDGVEIVSTRGRWGSRRCGLCSKSDDMTQFQECLEKLVKRKNETLDLHLDRRTEHHSVGPGCRSNERERMDMDIQHLVDLNAQLKRAQDRAISAQLRWDHLIERSRLFSALMDDELDRTDVHGSTGPGTASLLPSSYHYSCCTRLRFFVQRLWIRRLRYHTYRIIAVITAILSAVIFFSEVTLAVPLNLSPFSWMLHALDNNGDAMAHPLLFQISALIPLLYMSVCVYTCLFKLSLLGPYCLRGSRQSHGIALIFNAQYLMRLQFPLGYNYLLMLKYVISDCAFHTIMSDMSTIPFFGTSFSVYAPLLIVAVCLFTFCDAYPKLLHVLGIEHEDALLLEDQATLETKMNEGIQLMKRETDLRNDEVAATLINNSENSVLNNSPDKLALVKSYDNDDDLNGCCRGRYS